MSQYSTGLSDHERPKAANVISARGPPAGEPPLDYLYRWKDFCALIGVDRTTAWRLVRDGKGPVITKLTGRLIGVRHRHYLAWLAAREQHMHEWRRALEGQRFHYLLLRTDEPLDRALRGYLVQRRKQGGR